MHSAMRILITGGRAPATLHLIRLLAHNKDHILYTADSTSIYLSKYSNKVKKAFSYAKPNSNKDLFKRQVLQIIENNHINILIPTCEEIYHLSEFQEEITALNCFFMSDSLEKLIQLHSKWEFYNTCKKHAINTPETSLTIDEIPFPMIAKGIYSRSGNQICILKDKKDFKLLEHKEAYLFQQQIEGMEICTFSFAYNGKAHITVMYKSAYKLHKNSPNICYHPIKDEQIEQQVNAFIEKLNWNGQIGFDIIKTSEGKIYFIECNPRLTGGIFLLDHLCLKNNFLTGKESISSYGIRTLLYISQFRNKEIKMLLKSKTKIKDCTFDTKDMKPFFSMYIYFLKNVVLKILKKKRITEIFVEDIEWNGNTVVVKKEIKHDK